MKLILLVINLATVVLTGKVSIISVNKRHTTGPENNCKVTTSDKFEERIICSTLIGGLEYINEKILEQTIPVATVKLQLVSPISIEREVTVDGDGRLNLTIQSSTGVEVIGTCTNMYRNETCNGSLSFKSIKHLKIDNVKFRNLGNSKTDTFCLSAIVITKTEIVTLTKISVSNSTGGGLCITNISSSVYIGQSNFSNNWLQPSKNYIKSSGGIWISTGVGCTAIYNITECVFAKNSATRYKGTEGQNIGKTHGGGLYFNVQMDSKACLTVSDSRFISNRATFGGGASIDIRNLNSTSKIKAEINNCVFLKNIAEKSIISNGGGLQLLLESGNVDLTVMRTNFTSNDAYFGGGTSITSKIGNWNNNTMNTIFIDCIWTYNTATSGAAVDISRMFETKKIFESLKFTPEFRRCMFTKNKVQYNQTNSSILQESLGNGIFSISLMNVKFDKKVMFSENKGSAILGVNTQLMFNCSEGANFSRNTGINGGALSLETFSRLNITNGTSMFFVRNHAISNGGAIYLHIPSDHMLFISSACPFYNSVHNSRVHFSNNTAQKHGETIYFTSLLPCQMELSKTNSQYLKAEDVFSNRTCFMFMPEISKYDIATAPSKFQILQKTVIVHPGEETDLNLTLIDNLNNTVNDTVFFQVFDIPGMNKHTKISKKTKNNMCISHKQISLKGKENDSGEILLQTMDKPILNILLSVKMAHCPPGYIFNNKSEMCTCKADKFYGFRNCTSRGKFKAFIYNTVWVGYIKESQHGEMVFVSGICYWYCHSYTNTFIPRHDYGNNTQLTGFVCRGNRTGIMCSNCKGNFSASYNTGGFRCIPNSDCRLGWLFLILSDVLPCTIIIVAVMVFNINVASGNIQGFLLFCHMLVTVPVYPRSQFHSVGNKYWRYMLYIFYYPLDLKVYNSIPPFCIIKGATGLQNLAMTYCVMVYSLFLILAVVLFMRCFNRKFRNCNRYIRFTTTKNSAIHGILALFLLSYTRCVQTSLILLQPAKLYKQKLHVVSIRAALYGEYEYFSQEHLAYAIPAIFFMILLLIPTFMLFFYPFIVKMQTYFNMEPRNSKISYAVSKYSCTTPSNRFTICSMGLSTMTKDTLLGCIYCTEC